MMLVSRETSLGTCPFPFFKEPCVIKPKIIIIETTSDCNLHCANCYRSKESITPSYMSLELFKSLIDQIDWPCYVAPFSYGEPFLHPDFALMLDYCAYKKVKVAFSTNGTLLREDVLETCFNNPSNIKQICVSLDGFYPATRTALRGLRSSQAPTFFVEGLLQRNTSLPEEQRIRLAVSLVKMGQSQEEIELFIYFWLQEGVDMVLIRNILDLNPLSLPLQKEECFHLTGRVMTVKANGKASLCEHYARHIETGNVEIRSLLDIYNSGMRSIREDFPTTLCQKCPIPYNGSGFYGSVRLKGSILNREIFLKTDYYNSIYSFKDVREGTSW